MQWILRLSSLPDCRLISHTMDFLDGFLSEDILPQTASHPLFGQLGELRDLILNFLVLPDFPLDESMIDSVQSLRSDLGVSFGMIL